MQMLERFVQKNFDQAFFAPTLLKLLTNIRLSMTEAAEQRKTAAQLRKDRAINPNRERATFDEREQTDIRDVVGDMRNFFTTNYSIQVLDLDGKASAILKIEPDYHRPNQKGSMMSVFPEALLQLPPEAIQQYLEPVALLIEK